MQHKDDHQLGIYAEILAYLASDLLVHKPQDPITHLLRTTLTFPFHGFDPNDSQECISSVSSPPALRRDTVEGESPSRRARRLTVTSPWSLHVSEKAPTMLPLTLLDSIGQGVNMTCCTFDLVPAFGSFSTGSAAHADSHNATHRLMEFLTNPHCNILIVVGGSDSMDFGAKRRHMEEDDAATMHLTHSTSLTRSVVDSPTVAEKFVHPHHDADEAIDMSDVQGSLHLASPGATCDCSGSGKSRLCRWLQMPGRYFHRREIMNIDSHNVQHLMHALAEVNTDDTVLAFENRLELSLSGPNDKSGSATPTTKELGEDGTRIRGAKEAQGGAAKVKPAPSFAFTPLAQGRPTLTLIDNIEPPHIVLHALLQHNYFKNVNNGEPGRHKTILFTRPNVFYKFPLQCPVYHLVRRCLIPGQSRDRTPMAPNVGHNFPSFSALIGPVSAERSSSVSLSSKQSPSDGTLFHRLARGSSSDRRTRKISFASGDEEGSIAGDSYRSSPADSDLLQRQRNCIPCGVAYRENKWGPLSGVGCQAIIAELQEWYLNSVEAVNKSVLSIGHDEAGFESTVEETLQVPMNLSNSETFRKLKLSRATVERCIAHFIVHNETIPLFDLSQLPRMVQEMVAVPRSYIYLFKFYNKIKFDLTRRVVSRLIIGNFLCLIITAQQSLVPYTLPVTASDALQLYLNTFCNALKTPTDDDQTQKRQAAADGAAQAVGVATSSFASSHERERAELVPTAALLRHREVSFVESLSTAAKGGGGGGGGGSGASDGQTANGSGSPGPLRPRLSFSERDVAGTALSSLLCETLTYLSLENIVIERSVIVSTALPPLVAHLLLDTRGTDITVELATKLTKGTTRQQLRRRSVHTQHVLQQHQQQKMLEEMARLNAASEEFASPLRPTPPPASADSAERGLGSPSVSEQETPLVPPITLRSSPPPVLPLQSTSEKPRRQSLGGASASGASTARRAPVVNPIVLTSDITEIGRSGYQERRVRTLLGGASSGQPPCEVISNTTVFTFSINLLHQGLRAILVVERARIFAQVSLGIANDLASSDHGPSGSDKDNDDDTADLNEPKDGHQVLWEIEFSDFKIIHAALHVPPRLPSASSARLAGAHGTCHTISSELLSLLMHDGSAVIICPDEIHLGASIVVRQNKDAPNGFTASIAAAQQPSRSGDGNEVLARQVTTPSSSIISPTGVGAVTSNVSPLNAKDIHFRNATGSGFSVPSASMPSVVLKFNGVERSEVQQQQQQQQQSGTQSLEVSGDVVRNVQMAEIQQAGEAAIGGTHQQPLLTRRNFSNVALMSRNNSTPSSAWESFTHPKPQESHKLRLRFLDDFIQCFHASHTAADDPAFTAISPSFAAACGQDAEIAVVIRHRFGTTARESELAHTASQIVIPPSAVQSGESFFVGDSDALADSSKSRPDSIASPMTGAARSTTSRCSSHTSPLLGEETPVGRRVETVVQAPDIVSSMCIVKDRFLVLGLDSGTVMVRDFLSDTGAEMEKYIEFNESRISVVCSMEFYEAQTAEEDARASAPSTEAAPPAAGEAPPTITVAVGRRAAVEEKMASDLARDGDVLCIAGSDDHTMSIISLISATVIRSIRVHEASVVDIAANCANTHKIIVSLDRMGTIVVHTFNPEKPKEKERVLWTTIMSNLKGIHLCVDANWLICNRNESNLTAAAPLAVPISEWVRLGTGQFHTRPISAIHISRNERYVLTGGEDGSIFVWDMQDNMNYVTSFREHRAITGAKCPVITAISTSWDCTRVLSSDDTRFVFLWSLRSGQSLRVVARSDCDYVRFLPYNYYMIRSRVKGVRIFDSQDKLLISNSRLLSGSIDTIYLSNEDFESCFADLALPMKEASNPPSPMGASRGGGIRARMTDSTQLLSPITAGSTPEELMFPTTESQRAGAVRHHVLNRCFIGVAYENSDAEDFGVQIFQVGRLRDEQPSLTLQSDEIEDDWGDEDEVFHSDTIKSFRFLQPRKRLGPDSDEDPFFAPTLFIAATVACDLTAIVWNWRKQTALFRLQHTAFLNDADFFYPQPYLQTIRRDSATQEGNLGDLTTDISMPAVPPLSPSNEKGSGAHGHDMQACFNDAAPLSFEDKEFIVKNDPRQNNDNGVIFYLLTCQDADDKKVTLRVFEIRVKSAQKRRQIARSTSKAFNYGILECVEVAALASPNTDSSVQCICVRPSDGLVCTGHDRRCEVVFWKWLPDSHTALHRYTSSASFFSEVNSPTRVIAGRSATESLRSTTWPSQRSGSHVHLLGSQRSTTNVLGVGVSRPRVNSVVSVTAVGDHQFAESKAVKRTVSFGARTEFVNFLITFDDASDDASERQQELLVSGYGSDDTQDEAQLLRTVNDIPTTKSSDDLGDACFTGPFEGRGADRRGSSQSQPNEGEETPVDADLCRFHITLRPLRRIVSRV